ncbi:MAG: tRNA preQ1(34) S-adenosylmethionine ribosyltransferase-isomerase QueA [Candidatus Omnitrophica bacterium]|nr:tRNA preQ1(34) S-adenosylmethionine ribosyltransferase-isomerase QueA [Candidatus Omnitrophota bacterium]
MRVDEFDYSLPEELIADRPAPERTGSRLMVVDRASGEIAHRHFSDLPTFLQSGDLLVVNNTEVIPARLMGAKRGGGARIEILLLEERSPLLWECIAQRAIRLSPGTIVDFPDAGHCEVTEVLGEGRFLFRFHPRGDWRGFLETNGETPLPPYILKRRGDLSEEDRLNLRSLDKDRYQTSYAWRPGSAAAPTAGLHFTKELFAELKEKGIAQAQVTLHVGMDTFAPVTVDQVEDHQMKSEWCECPPPTRLAIHSAKTYGGRVVAVGTTTTRTLESYSRQGWPEEPIRTDLFLKPGDEFQVVDSLITNFHLPKSTLLMMISAFMGNDLRVRAYEEAVAQRYRFYSYGDAMLIL